MSIGFLTYDQIRCLRRCRKVITTNRQHSPFDGLSRFSEHVSLAAKSECLGHFISAISQPKIRPVFNNVFKRCQSSLAVEIPRVFSNVFKMCKASLAAEGHHFKRLLKMKVNLI